MADPKWEDTEAVDIPSFEDTQEIDVEKVATPGEAFTGGLTSDLSFGLLDELKGGLEAGGQAIGIKGLGKEFGEQELTQPKGIEGLLDTYREGRDFERGRQERLEEQEPGSYKAGRYTGTALPIIAGGVSGLLKKGVQEVGEVAGKELLKEGTKGGLLEAAKKSLPVVAGGAKTGAKYGALAGAGYSEADLLEDPTQLTKDVALGGVVGGATGAVLPAAVKTTGKALGKIGKGVTKANKFLTQKLTGLDEATLEEVLKRSDDIKNIIGYDEVQNVVLNKINKLYNVVNTKSDLAKTFLKDDPFISKKDLIGQLNGRSGSLKGIAKEQAAPHFQSIIRGIDDFSNNDILTQKQFHDLVKDIGKRGRFDTTVSNHATKEMNSLYHTLSSSLKDAPGVNPQFKNIQKEISERLSLADKVTGKLGLEYDFNKLKVVSQDRLLSKLKEVGVTVKGTEKKDVSKLLDNIEDYVGIEKGTKPLTDQLRAERLSTILEQSGSKFDFAIRTMLGSVLGGPLGVAAGVLSRPASTAVVKKAGKLKGILPSKSIKAVKDKAIELGAPLSKKLTSGQTVRVAVSDKNTEERLDDPSYLEGLLDAASANPAPGIKAYEEQLKQYQETDDYQEKKRIRFNLSQQSAFRKLLNDYDKNQKGKK